MGRKKRPFYRIVATDSRTRRDGKYLEKIGTYNPLTQPAEIEINKELALKWLARGAQPSQTVRSFLRKTGILFEYDLRKRGLSAEEIELEYKKWNIIKEERLKKAEALAAMQRRDVSQEEDKPKAKARAKVETTIAEESKADDVETPVADAETTAEEDKQETAE